MSAAELDLHSETESERIARWRAEELERAGYGPDDAVELAGRPYVDLHLAIELIERGCPADTAVRILLQQAAGLSPAACSRVAHQRQMPSVLERFQVAV